MFAIFAASTLWFNSLFSRCPSVIDCTCFGAARQKYHGVDTLKELSRNVECRNIVAFIKDTNFYYCI